jgi:hypothetical protein
LRKADPTTLSSRQKHLPLGLLNLLQESHDHVVSKPIYIDDCRPDYVDHESVAMLFEITDIA